MITYSFNTAAADIIDNSIAANATDVNVAIELMEDGRKFVCFGDNGDGMDAGALFDAMRYGAPTRADKASLGKFGLGLKTASTSVCLRLTVISRKSQNDAFAKLAWDLEHVEAENEWVMLKEDVTADELDLFEELCGDKGTLVIWSKCDRLLSKEYAQPGGVQEQNAIRRLSERLREHVALIYYRFLDPSDTRERNVVIRIDGEAVEAWNPFYPEKAEQVLPDNLQRLEVEDEDGTVEVAHIRGEVEDGTGAVIGLEVSNTGVQQGLKLWFDDLGRARSPIVELRPKGLSRYEARLSFGNFAAETVQQMMRAADEEKQLARALVRSVATDADVTCNDQSLEDWEVRGPDFTIIAERRGVRDRFGEEALTETCRKIVTPMLAAMAELYGYDPVEDAALPGAEAVMEGAVRLSQVKRRERNPRNRLLCLRIHGNRCAVCGADPARIYGEAGNVIEVHHIQPLSIGDGAKPYSPETDLIPLCPTCHRAAHTQRPIPWSPDELRGLLKSNACVA